MRCVCENYSIFAPKFRIKVLVFIKRNTMQKRKMLLIIALGLIGAGYAWAGPGYGGDYPVYSGPRGAIGRGRAIEPVMATEYTPYSVGQQAQDGSLNDYSSIFDNVESAGNHLRVTGNGSFMQMHEAVADANSYSEDPFSTRPMMRAKNRPGTNPTGQYPPIGDALWPLLLMAIGYLMYRKRNEKRCPAGYENEN